MADLGGYDMRRQPTAAEVVGRLKDDGDFDALRRAIIRKVKDNDVGSKIMGQISDEVWSVIQSKETDIRGTVEFIFNRIMNPEQQQDAGPSSKKLKRNGKEEQVSPPKASTSVTAKPEEEDDDPEAPPGFGFSNHQSSTSMVKLDQPLNGENHSQVKPSEDKPVDAGSLGDADDEDPDVPPGFG